MKLVSWIDLGKCLEGLLILVITSYMLGEMYRGFGETGFMDRLGEMSLLFGETSYDQLYTWRKVWRVW